jgi:hypothetical protein
MFDRISCATRFCATAFGATAKDAHSKRQEAIADHAEESHQNATSHLIQLLNCETIRANNNRKCQGNSLTVPPPANQHHQAALVTANKENRRCGPKKARRFDRVTMEQAAMVKKGWKPKILRGGGKTIRSLMNNLLPPVQRR